MKAILKLATFTVLTLAMAAQAFAAPKNLVAGVGPLSSAAKWDGKTAFSVIPGASLFPTTSKTTAFYIAFTEGAQAEIGNMVLYQTGARDGAITAVTPMTLNGVSNPSINLTDPAVCPDQPVSVTAPCIVRLDQITLSPQSCCYAIVSPHVMRWPSGVRRVNSLSPQGLFEG